MMNFIFTHFPALQVIAILFGAVISIFVTNKSKSYFICLITLLVAVVISLIGSYQITNVNLNIDLNLENNAIYYIFGNFSKISGIEYKINSLNQNTILYLNIILLLLIIFNKDTIEKRILAYVDNEKANIFYSVILFAHFGYLGIISSNDLFNIYVFIEISSLATYAITAGGKNISSTKASFNYLIFGTIGASLILIAIGLIFSISGNLNIDIVSNIIQNNYANHKLIIITAFIFAFVGLLLKISFFPLHFWLIKSYINTESILLSYFAAISTIIGSYLIYRFLYNIIPLQEIRTIIYSIFKYIAIFAIMICSIQALKQKYIKNIIIYSTCSQIGYVLLLFSFLDHNALNGKFLLLFLLFDSLNKVNLFNIVSYFQQYEEHPSVNSNFIITNNIFKICFIISIIFSAGIPISGMFFLKVKIFEIILQHQNHLVSYLILMIIVISSLMSLIYHYNIARCCMFKTINPLEGKIISNKTSKITILILFIQSICLFINI